jgi:hypothetical protein
MDTNNTNANQQPIQGERGLNWRVASPREVLAASKVTLRRYAREGGAQPMNESSTPTQSDS